MGETVGDAATGEGDTAVGVTLVAEAQPPDSATGSPRFVVAVEFDAEVALSRSRKATTSPAVETMVRTVHPSADRVLSWSASTAWSDTGTETERKLFTNGSVFRRREGRLRRPVRRRG